VDLEYYDIENLEADEALRPFRNKHFDFLVTITNTDDALHGCIKVKDYDDFFRYLHITSKFYDSNDFDPLNIIGDLFEDDSTDLILPNFEKTYPLLFKHKFNNGLLHQKIIRDFILGNRCLPLNSFELFKQSHKINIDFLIFVLADKATYKRNSYNNVYGVFELESDLQNMYIQLNMNGIYDIQSEIKSYGNAPVQFVYTCKSNNDVMASILHYLLFFDYKFSKCQHCGKYFATKTFKQKYCNRKSPYAGYGYLVNAYKGYGHLVCHDAVRNIRQSLARRYQDINEYLTDNYKGDLLSEFNNQSITTALFNEYNNLLDKIKECSSLENLKTLDMFLSIENIKKNWYDKGRKNSGR